MPSGPQTQTTDRRRLRRAPNSASTFGLLLALCGTLAAEEAKTIPPLIDSVNVEVVNVDVVVTDATGLPVAGLTADDFTLSVDGEERQISNFFSFTNGQPTARQAPTQAPDEPAWPMQNLRRRMALLFDVNSLDTRRRDAAIESLEKFVLEQFDSSYEWAVVAYGDRLRMLQPFTSDKSIVIGALGRIKAVPVPSKQRRASDPAFSENPVVASRSQAFGTAQAIDQSSQMQLTAQDFEIRERMLSGLERFDRTALAMTETMRAYSALPGRKSLVLVSGAIDTLPSGPQLLGYGLPGLGGGERADPLIHSLQVDLQQRYKAIVQTANATGFAIYPISGESGENLHAPYLDVGREGTVSFSQGGTSRKASEIDDSSTQQILAAGTGGVFYRSTHFYDALDDIDQRTGNAYVLGFTTDHLPERDYHRIEVKAKAPGLRVRSREGYLHMSRQDRLVEELATPLYFPKDRGDFEVALQVMPPERIKKKTADLTVAGVLPLEKLTLVPQGDRLVGRIFLFLAVYDRDGQLHRLVREHQDLSLEPEHVAAFPADAPARFGTTVKKLERGEYTFTLTLMDEVTQRYGTGVQAAEL